MTVKELMAILFEAPENLRVIVTVDLDDGDGPWPYDIVDAHITDEVVELAW